MNNKSGKSTLLNKEISLNRYAFLFSLVLNIILLAFFTLLFYPAYETNDDNALAGIVAGFNGRREEHIIFVNVIIGYVIKALYTVHQSFPWYDIFQYFTCFCSLTAISYFLIKTAKNKNNCFLALIYIFFLAFELYKKTQFTKTAGFASAGGILLILLFTLFEEKKSTVGIILGIILASVGFMYRYKSFFISTVLCAAMGVYFLFSYKQIDKKVFTKKLVSCIICMAVLFGVCAVAYTVNKIEYSSPEWQNYLERNEVLNELYDYKGLNFDPDKLEGTELGIDQADLDLLYTWNTADFNFLSTENLKIMASCLNDPQKSYSDLAKGMLEYLIADYYLPFWLFTALFILFFATGKLELRKILTAAYVIFALLAMYILMYNRGRIFLNRVDCILWLVAALPIFLMLNQEKRVWNFRAGIAVCAVLLFCFMYNNYENMRMINKKEPVNIHKLMFERIANDPEHMYLSTPHGLSYCLAYQIFDEVPFDACENMFYLGGWTSFTPADLENLKKFDISNPFEDIVDNPNVYIVDDPASIDVTVEYIRKHYNKDATAVFKEDLYGRSVYSIVSQ